MSELRVGRLFHGIVVVGAAVGCGADATTRDLPVATETPAVDPSEPEPTHVPPPPEDSLTAADCGSPQQFRCTAQSVSVDCYCDPEAPLSADACEYNRFVCESYEPPTGCQCDTNILIR